jgi:UDP-glucose 4-epimerase
LVTGAAGFIGCNVARHLVSHHYTVVTLDNLSLGKAENLPSGIPLVIGDVQDAGVWRSLPPVDAIVHLAGASSTPMFAADLSGSFQNNVTGFLRALEYAQRSAVPRVVYASTSLIYGNVPPPLRESGNVDVLNFYAVSKYCMEQIAQLFYRERGTQVVGLRFMSVYGPREDHKGGLANLVSQFIWGMERGETPVVYGDGNQTRDFTSVWDVAQAVRLALESPYNLAAKIYNVGTGTTTSINALITLLAEMMGVAAKARYVPIPAGRAYNYQQQASLESIVNELGYRPTISLERGIDEILRLRGCVPNRATLPKGCTGAALARVALHAAFRVSKRQHT